MSSKRARTRKGQVASRQERQHPVDLSSLLPGLLNHDGSSVSDCVVVVNTVAQQESACAAAHSHVEQASPTAERAKAAFVQDLDVLANAKMIEVLHRSFRIKGDEKYPLFPSPEWMRDGLTGIGVGILSNLYAECQRAEEPDAWPEIDRDKVEDTMALCAEHFGDDIPELVLAQHAREWLSQWIVMASYYLDRERRKAAALVDSAQRLLSASEPPDDETLSIWDNNATAWLSELPEGTLKIDEAPPEDDDAVG